jgi:acyl-CoA synthetase (AMP-forming)/AMP-acid ligase II
MNLLERLRASQGKLISAAGTIPFQQLASEALKSRQQFAPGSRILLWTDDVRQLIVTLAAAEHAGADAYIAHRTIARPEIDSMLERFGITHLAQPGAIEPLKAEPGAPSRFVYVMTSGTTRAPKVARHTLSSLFGTIQSTQSSRHSRWLLTFPPTAFAGLQVVFSAVLGGGDLVVPSERTMEAFAQAAAAHAVTHISGTPTFWRSFLLVLGDRELSLQQVTVGGEAVDQATLDRLKQRFPSARITHIYASTEAGVGFSVHDCRAGIPAAWISAGVGDVQLRVNDGVLEIKSPRALKRYESGEATPLDSEGWLSSGDLVRLEGDRYLFVGRTDRRLNVGGFKITPEEVEAVLMGCDAVADVQVSGVASPISGQVLCATVVPRSAADRDQVKKAVQQFAYQRLEPFKVPRVIRIVEALQAADSGKKARP